MSKRRLQMKHKPPRCYTQSWWQKIKTGEWEHKQVSWWQRTHLWTVKFVNPHQLAGSQLEISPHGWTFKKPDMGLEMRLCSHYYEKANT